MTRSTDLPTLVLLPALISDARMWVPQINGLADLAHIVVGDLTGADNMADLASAVLASAPPGPFALAGLSMGGYVALEVMRQAPRRITALALLDTSARADTPEATTNRRKAMARAEADFGGVITDLLPKLVAPDQVNDKSITDILAAMARDAGKETFRQQQTAIIGRPDSRPLLAGIRCPTLVLCGREDLIIPLEVHEEMAAGIAGARLRVIEQCGHVATLCQPAEVTSTLRQWLSGALTERGATA
ncbi:MAG: hypothetical protein JWL63_806 [Rhodocyclales bacterium]|nr:hypothetical protein [Rhodocyclales bacterium]